MRLAAAETPVDLATLWTRYRREGDQAAHETLIRTYAPLVKYVAGRLSLGLPPHVDRDDLLSAGIMGLLDAISRFDPDRGLKFETYALSRIKGAMLDSLRQLDWIPRRTRERLKKYDRCVAELERELGREPQPEEVRQAMGLTEPQFQSLMQELSWATVSSLDELIGLNPEATALMARRELVAGEDNLDELVINAELKEALATAMTRLTPKERLVIGLYYGEGLTGREIAEVLEVSEARVSQLHTQAILRLRAALQGWQG